MPESLTEIQYAEQLRTIFTLNISGEVQMWNLVEYFHPGLKKIEKRGQLNYRMFMTGFAGFDESLRKNATAILWIEQEKLLLVGSSDCCIYVLVLGANQELFLKLVLASHTNCIKRMRFCPRTKYVYSVANNNLINVWNPYVKKPITSINAFKDIDKIIIDVVIPEKNNVLVGISEIGQLIVWDMLNYARVTIKYYGQKCDLTVFETKPFLITGGASVNIIEYGTQINKEKIY
jgi:WD40 repeat protein